MPYYYTAMEKAILAFVFLLPVMCILLSNAAGLFNKPKQTTRRNRRAEYVRGQYE